LHVRKIAAVALLCLTGIAFAQLPTLHPESRPTSGSATTTESTPAMPSAQSQNPFLGSRVEGQPTAGAMRLSLLDAIERGLRNNLGLLLSSQQTETARGQRWRSLSDLLPTLTTRVGVSAQEINLQAFGIPLAAGERPVVGPFGIFDMRGLVSAPLVDLQALNKVRAGTENIRAAELSARDAREFVVLVVGGTYLNTVAASARVDAAQAEFNTADTLYRQAVDMKNAGVVPAIEVLRAQVEAQARQQRLVAARNDFERAKLTLGRAIGLPGGQQIELAEQLPYQAAPDITLEQALARAYQARADYLSARARVHAAELNRRAASAERLPSLLLTGDYGLIGPNPGLARQTFSTTAAVELPIFQGGKVRGDVEVAEAALQQRRLEADDLRARIEFEVRTAFLDVQSAAQQVEVAQQAVKVADEAMRQSGDRFAAGVTGNLEVVQAQQALATAHENFISALNAHNIAKLLLARSVGVAEQRVRDYLKGTP
jgi:outer membrane protein TolC